MAEKKRVKYLVVDAFAESAFKGNPAAVCLLDDDNDNERDDAWLQSLAAEFNLSETCFLTPIIGDFPRFRLRWFTPVAEVDLCGHATLASAHVLFSTGLIDSETVEFDTLSGALTAKHLKIDDEIELDFPVVPTFEVNYIDDDLSLFSKALNGATIVDVKATKKDILVVLSSWEAVIDLKPRLDEISKCPCEGMMVTASASAGSTFDFCSRYFAPRFGINEDPVTGSAHCALAHYWSLKMNKCDFFAYQVLSLHRYT
ncbi:Phenazine biosynthesis PhzF protein [Arabidopsis thaliana x Arabidopsis arenosa]|uniref:Phenazine biosynthesis PhzF protein n=1 Tax=Arabidopsis thaliana x Arabidopsis arenosa TaxID=1240361 RepID=A0A8T2BZ90_9BRAS|nr:Phenazine biosynthesis PhzF protein [Arabidopsis thaliana x Arabidopsis arenosa]